MTDQSRSTPDAPRRPWTQPKLRRLGTVRDIAQRDAPFNQAFQDKRS